MSTVAPAALPSYNSGLFILITSVLFFFLGTYAVLFSAFVPSTGVFVLDILANDTHYKYFSVLVVPMVVYFVIANWVGWQYYRNS